MRWIISACILAAASACLPLDTYYREGASVGKLERDLLACEVQALRDAPVANEVRVEPPRYIPPRKECDTQGACVVVRAGYWVEGDVYTVDVNEELRARVELQCMGDKGYTPARIPACPPAVAQNVPTRATQVLPKLSAQSCAIRNSDGTFQIVTRG